MATVELPSRPSFTTAQFIQAVDEATEATQDGLRFTDRYQVTYSGVTSHITLAALLREDITPNVGGHKTVTGLVRSIAWVLTQWFACEHTPPDHGHRFEQLTVEGVCRAAAYLIAKVDMETIRQVGPESLPLYTEFLLMLAEGEQRPGQFPNLVDSPRAWLGEPQDLKITATTADGSDTVTLHVDVEAREDIGWEFTTEIGLPVGDMHSLMTGGLCLSRYLEDNRDLIDGELDYASSELIDGLNVTAMLLPPRKRRSTPPRQAAEPVQDHALPTEVDHRKLYYIGTDPGHALSNGAFVDYDKATELLAEQEGYRLFTAEVNVHVSWLT